MKILFACGGTAGHINPAIAIADLLKRRIPGFCAVFIGTPEGMENRLVPSAGYPIRHIPVEKLRRSFSPRNLRAAFSLFRSFSVAERILKEEKPDLVLGTGGYVCYPLLRVASSHGIPTVLHESNAKAGVAARALSRRTDLVLLNFPSAERDFKGAKRIVVSGNPLRQEFYTLSREDARRRLGLPQNALRLLVFGGSLGAEKLNETVSRAVGRLLTLFPNLTVLHAVGHNKSTEKTADPTGRYEVRAYIDDMPTELFAADAAICRAGAMTVSEIAAASVPAILVPYPMAAGDHQTRNAEALSETGAAILLPDAELTPDVLVQEARRILSDDVLRAKMKDKISRFRVPDSKTVILREILALCPGLER